LYNRFDANFVEVAEFTTICCRNAIERDRTIDNDPPAIQKYPIVTSEGEQSLITR